MSELPKWPWRGVVDGDGEEFERKRADAALSRLRLAVSKLQAIETLRVSFESESGVWPGRDSDHSLWKSELAKEALAAIGELPSETA